MRAITEAGMTEEDKARQETRRVLRRFGRKKGNLIPILQRVQQRLGYLPREAMLEIARFWTSIAELNPDTGKFSIAGVMGPDEFHEKVPGSDAHGLKDNAYTNIMVVWLLEKAQGP